MATRIKQNVSTPEVDVLNAANILRWEKSGKSIMHVEGPFVVVRATIKDKRTGEESIRTWLTHSDDGRCRGHAAGMRYALEHPEEARAALDAYDTIVGSDKPKQASGAHMAKVQALFAQGKVTEALAYAKKHKLA